MAETRIVLREVQWETYEHLLADHLDASAPRFFHDRGQLEIMSPCVEHEELRWAISTLTESVAVAHSVEFWNLGSTTFRLMNLERGFEADTSFFFDNGELVPNGSCVESLVDAVPDLVIDVAIERSELNKLAVLGAFGVPEVWRHDGERMRILTLGDDGYGLSQRSVSLPTIDVDDAATVIAAVRTMSRLAWQRHVRDWAQGLAR